MKNRTAKKGKINVIANRNDQGQTAHLRSLILVIAVRQAYVHQESESFLCVMVVQRLHLKMHGTSGLFFLTGLVQGDVPW